MMRVIVIHVIVMIMILRRAAAKYRRDEVHRLRTLRHVLDHGTQIDRRRADARQKLIGVGGG
jgi:hypothetical protein